MNFNKYKRIFAFGCSFTGYRWPTWADILAKESPNATYYNFGKSGAGNLMITSRIAEVNARFNITADDLVLVMWTTFCREDRHNGTWITPGNIFTQSEYDDAFVKKYAQPRGYLIRDLSLISTSMRAIKNLGCDHLILAGVPWDHQMESTDNDVINVYRTDLASIPTSLLELEMDRMWQNGHTYIDPHYKHPFGDYHPNPLRYYSYLKKIGLPLTDRSFEYATKENATLLATKTIGDINLAFTSLNQAWHNNHKLVF